MTTHDSTQSRLFRELDDREAFESAHAHGMAYLDELVERAVFPTDEAITDLSAFDEDFPVDATVLVACESDDVTTATLQRIQELRKLATRTSYTIRGAMAIGKLT